MVNLFPLKQKTKCNALLGDAFTIFGRVCEFEMNLNVAKTVFNLQMRKSSTGLDSQLLLGLVD